MSDAIENAVPLAGDELEPVKPPATKKNVDDDPESVWLANVYKGKEGQLTLRAVAFGMLIGAVMCLSNIYVFFKTGWSMGVTITAAILAYSLFQGLQKTGLVKTPLTALENNALITVSSGAGYMTGGGNMAAFGALLMVTTIRPSGFSMVLWFGAIAALGVFTAIPIKRQLVNREGLAFPTGTATAVTLKALHGTAESGSEQSKEGAIQTRTLVTGALVAAVITWLRDAKTSWMVNIPSSLNLPFTLAGRSLADWSINFKIDLVQVGCGALMSFRTGWSMLLSGLLTYGVLAPAVLKAGLIPDAGYKNIVGWMIWPAAALLVSSGITSFLIDWRSVVRTFQGMMSIFSKKKDLMPIDEVECPEWWFPAGYLILGPIVVVLMMWLFQIPLWAGIIAVPLAIAMGFIAARVTGETDTTPTKALGPVTQLLYGAITPGNISGNIMSANVTGGIGLHAADLLTTLKTGWLLGGDPRVQFYAQLFGVLAGAAIVVPAFNLIIPDPTMLGSELWPAPSCMVWAGVSKAFASGITTLDPVAKKAVVAAFLLGIAMVFFDKYAPKKLKTYTPSAAGLGLAMVIPCSSSISIFLGSFIAYMWSRKNSKANDLFSTPIASGFIAGESLMGVAVAMMRVGGLLK